MIKAVLLDAFDILVYAQNPYAGYVALAEKATEMGHPLDLASFLVSDKPYTEIAPEGALTEDICAEIESSLKNITLYPDALRSLQKLRDSGFKVGLCAEATHEQAQVIRSLLPDLDCYALSAAIGSVKGDSALALSACNQLDVTQKEVINIGPSFIKDVQLAKSMGIDGIHLTRCEDPLIADLAYLVRGFIKRFPEQSQRRKAGIPSWINPITDYDEWEVKS